MTEIPDYQQAAIDLAAAMKRYSIDAELEHTSVLALKRVGGDVRNLPVTRDADGWAHREWRFALTIAGEMLYLNKPYRTGTGIHAAPTPVDLFAAVLTDAGCAAPYDGLSFDDAWIACADDLGAFEADAIARARRRKEGLAANAGLASYIKAQRDSYRECRTALELLREALGQEVTDELIALASAL